jgi:hypothetical protein
VLKDCDPPLTWAIASVRPCVGRTEPVERGIQSIWFLKTAVCKGIVVSPGLVDSQMIRATTHQGSMLLRANPYMPVTPFTQLAQLLHFGMFMLYVILDRKTSRIIHAHVAAESEEYSTGLVC